MKSKRARLLAGMLAAAICLLGLNASAALALSPSVETLAASSIGEKGATLNGKVNPNGAETKMYFEYGTTTGYGSKTAEVSVGSGSTTLEKAEAIGSLTANTLYHYRIVATNSSGTSQGVDKTFTTVGAPSISGMGATPEFNGQEATLKAAVDPNGQSTTYQFEYGTTFGSYPNVVPVPAASAGSGYDPVTADVKITGLTPGTTYYWRISATNASGKVSSSQLEFHSGHPGLLKVSASDLSKTGAALKAYVEPHEAATTYYFEYGTTISYGSKTTTKEISGKENVFVSEPVTGLKANTLYHFRVVATNASGTHIGSDTTFTTLTSATLYPKGGGEALKAGAALKAFSSKLSFSGETGNYSCGEAEFGGSVSENPGAVQSVGVFRMQTAGLACTKTASLSVKFTTPSAITIEYAKDGLGTAYMRTSKFVLKEAVYYNKTSLLAECEYNLVLAGSYATGSAIETILSGTSEMISSINPFCSSSEFISGTFAVTSGGTAVEAK
jgi:hypothetical protein